MRKIGAVLMKMLSKEVVTGLVLCCAALAAAGENKTTFADYFTRCKRKDAAFDNCIRDALNNVRPYFHIGVPEFGIPPFDPFFAEEVSEKRGSRNMNFMIKLMNVTERGWNMSRVLKFKSDPTNYQVKYYQLFPMKYLNGEYEVDTNMMGYPIKNKGEFTLTLVNYTQTTTVTRRPLMVDGKMAPGQMKVRIIAGTARDMELHMGNLHEGRSIMERLVDRMINASWRPGFNMLKPLINDLVSAAFTKIFNDSLKDFPFEKIFP